MEESVQAINKIALDKVEKAKLEIGMYVLRCFYGDENSALEDKPINAKTLREFCKHKSLRVNGRVLLLWTKGAAVAQQLGLVGSAFQHLTLSHYLELVRLGKDVNLLRQLAVQANARKWSVRDLRQKIYESLPSTEDVERDIRRLVADPLRLMANDETAEKLKNRGALSKLKKREQLELIGKAEDVVGKMRKSKALLEDFIDDLTELCLKSGRENQDSAPLQVIDAENASSDQ